MIEHVFSEAKLQGKLLPYSDVVVLGTILRSNAPRIILRAVHGVT